MIDPSEVIHYNADDAKLQEFWLFCLLVAGKNAKVQAAKLDAFLGNLYSMYATRCGPAGNTPFALILKANRAGTLLPLMQQHGLGQYKRLLPAFRESLALDLRKATLEELQAVHGVGPKTARYFVVYSRPDANHAVLDTHILAYLRENGHPYAPQSTPPEGANYRAWEDIVLGLAADHCMTPADFDLAVWNSRSQNGNRKPVVSQCRD